MPPLAVFLVGVAVGVSAVLFGPSVAPQVRRNLRPTAMAGVKTAVEVGHALRVRAAELSEEIEDFVAEACADASLQADDGATSPEGKRQAPPATGSRAPKRRAPRRRATARRNLAP